MTYRTQVDTHTLPAPVRKENIRLWNTTAKMKTKEYVRYVKYAGVAGIAMFVAGALGETTGRVVLTDVPQVADTAFVYLLGIGFAVVFVSIIAGGLLPLALE